jgi:hypothetical protein
MRLSLAKEFNKNRMEDRVNYQYNTFKLQDNKYMDFNFNNFQCRKQQQSMEGILQRRPSLNASMGPRARWVQETLPWVQ